MTTSPLSPCGVPGLPRRVLATLPDAGDALMDRIVDAIPYYRELTAAQRVEVRDIALAGLRVALGLWATGELAGPEQLKVFRAHGAARAAEGRPLALILQAYRVAGVAGFAYLRDGWADELDAAETGNVATLLMAFVDQLSSAVTEGYVDAAQVLTAQADRVARDVLEDLLTSRFTSVEGLRARAAALGRPLPEPARILVAAPADGSPFDVLAVEVVRALAGDRPSLHLFSRGQLVLLTDREVDALAPVVRRCALVGAVVTAGALTELAGAYRAASGTASLLARGLLPVGKHGPLLAETPVLLLEALRRATAAEPDLRDPLADRLGPELVATLRAFYDRGNAVSAAHALNIHPQTMRHRLRRVERLTGLDPALGWDRLFLDLTVRADTLRSSPGGRAAAPG